MIRLRCTRRSVAPVLASLFAIACAPEAPRRARVTDSDASSAPIGARERSSDAPGTWRVSAGGFGPVRVGTTLATAGAALGETLRSTATPDTPCAYVRPSRFPSGLSVMVTGDTVVRLDVRRQGVLTDEGVGVGDAEASVLAAYPGRVTVQPHKYTTPAGHYLVVTSPGDAGRRIVFETDGEVVTRYRAGRAPEVDLVEGCG